MIYQRKIDFESVLTQYEIKLNFEQFSDNKENFLNK
jgi:hypothetical protein